MVEALRRNLIRREQWKERRTQPRRLKRGRLLQRVHTLCDTLRRNLVSTERGVMNKAIYGALFALILLGTSLLGRLSSASSLAARS